MKSAFDIVMENRKELVNKLIEQMKKGYSPTQSLWDKGITAPYNPLSDCHYRAGNRFRLMLASHLMGFSDPRWMTFKQANEKHYKIKPGAKSVLLEKWIFEKEVPMLDEAGNVVKDSNGATIKESVPLKNPIVNYFRVFNAEQIEGIEPLPVHTYNSGEIDKVADAFIRSSKCPILYTHEQKAYYSPSKDEIHLPMRESFKSSQAHLSVLIHEMSHSTGHESRLDRQLKNSFGTPDYAREELNAELSSFFTQSDLGIKIEPDSEHLKDHANYIKSWISVLEENPNEFFSACAAADKISHFLMDNYEQTLSLSNNLANDLLANINTISKKASADIITQGSEWGTWLGHIADNTTPENYISVDITGYSSRHSVVYTVDLIQNNRIINGLSFELPTNPDNFSDSMQNNSSIAAQKIQTFLNNSLDLPPLNAKTFTLYSPFSENSLNEHYQALTKNGFSQTPDYNNTNENYGKKLKHDLKRNGIKPTKAVLSSIDRLNKLTNQLNSLKDIHSYYKENSFSPNSAEGKILKSLCNEFQHQQTIVHTSEPVMQL